MKYGKLVEYEGKPITAREAARRSGYAPSTVMKLVNRGKSLVRNPREGREPRRVMHDGRMLTAEEIAPLVGMAVVTVRDRMRLGLPVTRIRRAGPGAAMVEYEGRRVSLVQLAQETGQSTGKLYYRHAHGLPLTGEVKRKKRDPRITESGVFRVSRAEGENGLYWEDDLEARVWHLYCGGDGFGECTLEEIGALWGISRERVRQVQDVAVGKIRRAAQRGDKDACDALMWFEMRCEQRARQKLDHWEQAEANAPGVFDSAPRGKSGQRRSGP